MSVTLDLDVVAEHVLQVNLTFRPKVQNVLGSFNLWRKPGLFGSADELMKFCPTNGCHGFFRDSFHLSKEEHERLGDDAEDPRKWPLEYRRRYYNWFQEPVLCPECHTLTIRQDLPDSYGFNMTKDRIANKMAYFFDKLGRNADIYMVRTKEDMIFQKAKQELTGDQNQYRKLLDRARDRHCVYYGLKDIIKDTSTAASTAARFKALLNA